MKLSIASALFALVLAGCTKDDGPAESAGGDESAAATDETATAPEESGNTDEAARPPAPEVVPVAEVARLKEAGEATICDANSSHVRGEYGSIPGAMLLSHPTDFDASELPEDKSEPLVFYCANTRCGASETSATRAIVAGYTDVSVMREGIQGWVEAGHETTVQ